MGVVGPNLPASDVRTRACDPAIAGSRHKSVPAPAPPAAKQPTHLQDRVPARRGVALFAEGNGYGRVTEEAVQEARNDVVQGPLQGLHRPASLMGPARAAVHQAHALRDGYQQGRTAVAVARHMPACSRSRGGRAMTWTVLAPRLQDGAATRLSVASRQSRAIPWCTGSARRTLVPELVMREVPTSSFTSTSRPKGPMQALIASRRELRQCEAAHRFSRPHRAEFRASVQRAPPGRTQRRLPGFQGQLTVLRPDMIPPPDDRQVLAPT